MDLINQYYVAVPTPVEPWTGKYKQNKEIVQINLPKKKKKI